MLACAVKKTLVCCMAQTTNTQAGTARRHASACSRESRLPAISRHPSTTKPRSDTHCRGRVFHTSSCCCELGHSNCRLPLAAAGQLGRTSSCGSRADEHKRVGLSTAAAINRAAAVPKTQFPKRSSQNTGAPGCPSCKSHAPPSQSYHSHTHAARFLGCRNGHRSGASRARSSAATAPPCAAARAAWWHTSPHSLPGPPTAWRLGRWTAAAAL